MIIMLSVGEMWGNGHSRTLLEDLSINPSCRGLWQDTLKSLRMYNYSDAAVSF